MCDTISRQAAIDALCKGEGCGNICRRGIERIPSAERRGRWELNIDDKGWSWDIPYVCDQCGKWNGIETPYCPHCGAKMDGDEE